MRDDFDWCVSAFAVKAAGRHVDVLRLHIESAMPGGSDRSFRRAE
jgi:hypothetical protein